MRMSSGASKRKLKPRAGSSICGELTPRSSSTPCTCVDAVLRQRLAHAGEAGVQELQPRRRRCASAARGRWPAGPCRRRSAGPAATAAPGWRAHGRRGRRCRPRRWPSGACTSASTASSSRTVVCVHASCAGAHRLRPSTSSVMPAATTRASTASWRCLSHSSRRRPMPISSTSLFRPAASRSSGGIEHARGAVDLDVDGAAQEDAAPAVGGGLQRHQFGSTASQVGRGIDQQVAVGVAGQRQLAVAGRHQRVAMTHRHVDAPLGVQHQALRSPETPIPTLFSTSWPLNDTVSHKNHRVNAAGGKNQ